MAPETEEAQPRAEVERRRGERLAAQEAVSHAENALKFLILSDDDADLWGARLAPVEETEVELVEVDVAAAMEKALASRPELEAAGALLERRRAEAAFARNAVHPALDAVVSYDRFGLAGSQNPAALSPGVPAGTTGGLGRSFARLGGGGFDAARVALQFGIPVGNRAGRAVSAAAGHVERQAEAGLARARKAVRVEVLDAAAALHTARQRIQAARAQREATEVQLAAERDRYAVGLSTNFLVLTRQNDLSLARLAEISALTDYRTARTEMARRTGSLLERRRIPIDELLQTE
jgi:outer membrane protein TolC